jgi:hypothetical protein
MNFVIIGFMPKTCCNNQVAVDYIWKRFNETNISEAAFKAMEEVETIQKFIS